MAFEISGVVSRRGRLYEEIIAVGKRKATKVSENIAGEAARRAQAIVAREYNNSRPASRRRYPGSPRLLTSFKGTVTSIDDDAIRISLTSKSPIANILHNGAAPHTIRPTGGRKFLVFPSSDRAFVPTTRRARAALAASKSKKFFPQTGRSQYSATANYVRRTSVNHPGVGPGKFMSRAMRQAIDAAKRESA